jgi:hypothetical protein
MISTDRAFPEALDDLGYAQTAWKEARAYMPVQVQVDKSYDIIRLVSKFQINILILTLY